VHIAYVGERVTDHPLGTSRKVHIANAGERVTEHPLGT